jgi:membrane protease YdiL (CAAX protease family)
MRFDALVRLLPFAVLVAAAQLAWRPRWLGLAAGDVRAQLLFGLLGLPVMFGLAATVQLRLTRRRGVLRVPAGPADAALQAGYYMLNAPLEEAFFRGLVQGGVSVLLAPAAGFVFATAAYVLYHRLGAWSWSDTAATALAGVPFGLAFWLLPGAPSILGVSLAHVGATCGFIGPGPYLLKRLKLL